MTTEETIKQKEYVLACLVDKNSSIKEAMRIIDRNGLGVAFVVNSKEPYIKEIKKLKKQLKKL